MKEEENITKAIQEFYKIRNIPYHISLNREPAHCCEGKSKLLAGRLKSLGYKGFLRAGLFRWSNLNLPKSLNSIKYDDISTHVFLEVENLEGESIFVDPTWNSELKDAGFLISDWDGKGSTSLAVSCYKIFSRKESTAYLDVFKYLDVDFYEAFNNYCDSFLKGEDNEKR